MTATWKDATDFVRFLDSTPVPSSESPQQIHPMKTILELRSRLRRTDLRITASGNKPRLYAVKKRGTDTVVAAHLTRSDLLAWGDANYPKTN